MRNDTKRLVEGALFVGIYCVFFLVSRFLGGFLESIAFFILPLPLAIFTRRYGYKKALIPFFAILILGSFFNLMSTIFYVLTANILGIVYGELIRRNSSDIKILLVCALTSMVVNTLTMVIFANLFNYDITTEINIIIEYIYKLMRINGDDEYLKIIVAKSIPTFIFFMGIVEGFLIHFANSFVLYRLKEINKMPTNIVYLTLPQNMAFAYIVVIILYLVFIPNYLGAAGIWGVVSTIIFNIFWSGVLLFFFQGYISSVLFAKRKNRMQIYLILVIVGIFLFTVYFVLIEAAIGFIFVISDYHKKLLYNKWSSGSW